MVNKAKAIDMLTLNVDGSEDLNPRQETEEYQG